MRARSRSARVYATSFPAAFTSTAAPSPARRRRARATLVRWTPLDVPYVATNGVAYVDREDARLCDVLTCVKYKAILQTPARCCGRTPVRAARPNRWRNCSPPIHWHCTMLAIVERCTFRLETGGQFPLFPIPRERERALLSAYLGLSRRTRPLSVAVRTEGRAATRVRARIIAHGPRRLLSGGVDIAAEAKRGVVGQAAGRPRTPQCARSGSRRSIRSPATCSSSVFTEERKEVPDIDIDFAHQDREKVIQYVYERTDAITPR